MIAGQEEPIKGPMRVGVNGDIGLVSNSIAALTANTKTAWESSQAGWDRCARSKNEIIPGSARAFNFPGRAQQKKS